MTAEGEQGVSAVGTVVAGSLTRGIEVRIRAGHSPQLGQYVIAPLELGRTLIGMVTDVLLRSAEPGAIAWPPGAGEDAAAGLLREVLADTAVYTAAEVSPFLELQEGALPVRARSLPRHFAPVSLASQRDVDAAFAAGDRDRIHLGAPLGMNEVEVCVDVERLFERSAGVFGKSGTGKTVLTFQLLDALIEHAGRAATAGERTVALIFDMHNDYGRQLKFEGGHRRSLRDRHPTDVCLYSLEANEPGQDGWVEIGTGDIEPEDLAVLQSTAQFTQAAIEAAHECASRLGERWVDELLAPDPGPRLIRSVWREGDEPDEVNWPKVAARLGLHPGSLDNLRRGLRRFERRQVVRSGSAQFGGSLNHIVQTLQGGKSVVIQFGRHAGDLTTYMLVANMLSRRIWDAYRRAVERSDGTGRPGVRGDEPNRLVIVIEEAHKFIDRALAGQSIFGQIARELRKYNVTLLVIDQRPSQIDPEVLSQIGTKCCFQLDSDADVEALVGGVAGRAALRQIVGSLESQQQALVFGHALPMPVVVRTPDLRADAPAGAALRSGRDSRPFRERLGLDAGGPERKNPLFS